MSERKLAHIERIDWIKNIEDADAIELVGVLGWQIVVAKKDNFKVGDLAVYIEIDSIVQDKPEFEFLRNRKFRIRTIKLRGQISQGLILPVDYLKDNNKFWAKGIGFFGEIGDDCTEALGITKYLSPSEREDLADEQRKIALERNRIKKYMMRYSWFRRLFLSKKQKSNFPYWVNKTDEERVQNLGDKFIQEHADKYVYVTEKIDYQSGTWTSKEVPRYSGWIGKLIPVKKVLFVVASRNLQTNDKESLYWQIAKKYNLESICKTYPGIIIQGEQGNSKVQGNKYSLSEPKMWVFNIITPLGKHFNYAEIQAFCHKNNLDIVPLIGFYKMSDIGSTVSEFVEFAKGKSTLANIHREGVVIRCIESGNKLLSFKAINNDFLLKYSE